MYLQANTLNPEILQNITVSTELHSSEKDFESSYFQWVSYWTGKNMRESVSKIPKHKAMEA